MEELKQRVAAGSNKTALAKEYNVSRQTLYSYLKTT
ncbi:helix-turn-helix domain-containing protein [Psychromonas aquimarina]